MSIHFNSLRRLASSGADYGKLSPSAVKGASICFSLTADLYSGFTIAGEPLSIRWATHTTGKKADIFASRRLSPLDQLQGSNYIFLNSRACPNLHHFHHVRLHPPTFRHGGLYVPFIPQFSGNSYLPRLDIDILCPTCQKGPWLETMTSVPGWCAANVAYHTPRRPGAHLGFSLPFHQGTLIETMVPFYICFLSEIYTSRSTITESDKRATTPTRQTQAPQARSHS